ncbi:MAG: DMT family transporter [Humidesulfovibrio sp.]|uniref:DMT family transporter n=1 Tax=Humidesulfovibrio sp. TaxID=2910988 RepID=UPI0027F32D1C|nr:DMT family transporter [Humidesulfovibrio sp.]MDQ7834372.1 DMT family transporter [Humidesulfovibrio sp.]
MQARMFKADALLMLTAIIWGAAFVAQRLGMEHIGPFTFNGIRFALGALALQPLIWRMQATRRREGGAGGQGLDSARLIRFGLLAGSVLFAGAALQQVGIVYTTAGKAGFITGLYVVMVPLFGLFLRQRSGAGTWIGALAAAVGLYLLSVNEDFTIAYGDVLELIGAVFWAGHVLLIGRLSPGMDATDAVKLASAQFAVCSLLSLGVAAATEPMALAGIGAAAVPILYGGLMSVGVAYTLQVVAQRDANPAHAAIILSLEAVFAAVAGYFVLDEVLALRALVGCGLMLGGMLVSQLRP